MKLGLEAGEHTLALAVEHGIQGVPVWGETLVNDGIDAALKPLRERGLRPCQVGAFGFNPLSADEVAQAHQVSVLEKLIPLAVDAGCPYIVIGPGNHHPSGFGAADPRNFTDAALDRMASALEPMIRLAENYGAKLSIEAYLKGAVSSADRFMALWRRLGSDALRCNIDVTSLYDFADMIDPSETMRKTCAALAGHYGLCHIKDVALADGFHIHIGLAPLGSSPTDWAEVLRLVAPNLPDDSWVILEHVSTPDEAAASLRLLKDAANQAGVSLT
jgi:sugar phosphate isomerase/epimerase